MPFYEITYETGRSSVAMYADDAECERAVGEQHRRALHGEPSGPLGAAAPAERVAKVRKYDKHPNELNPDQTMSADVLMKELESLVKGLADDNGVVDVSHLTVEVRALTHPMVTVKEHPFDSNFIMKENSEMDMAFLGKVE